MHTIHRKETVFSNALRYAVERGVLGSLPLGKVDWKAPETDDEIDFRFVPGPGQAKALITAVGAQGQRGGHLRAFFGCLYYAAMRPAEVTDLRMSACTLLEEGWGELVLCGSTPRVGSAWTDSGASFDSRGLKRRARKASAHPARLGAPPAGSHQGVRHGGRRPSVPRSQGRPRPLEGVRRDLAEGPSRSALAGRGGLATGRSAVLTSARGGLALA